MKMVTNKAIRWAARLGLAVLVVFITAVSCDQLNTGPYTIKAFFMDPNPCWNNMQDDVGKFLTEKTGITIEAEFVVGDAVQKINLIAASGQYPDIISPKGEAGVLVKAGALIDLEPLIEKYAPNIKKVIGNQMNRLRYSAEDPKIYILPTVDAVNHIYYDTDAFFKLQMAALKEQGYPLVKTLDDFERVIAEYVKAHPKTEDGKPTIGLSLLADDWRFVISVTNPAFWATGLHDDGEWYIDRKTFEAKPHHFRPEEREYFRWLNHMNDIGLLDKESFIQKYDQYLSKIASGRVVGLIDANWEIQDAINSLKAAGKFDKIYGRFGVVLKEGIKSAWNAPTGFRGGYGIGITTSCKDPVRVIKFLDYLASEEGQILINWGIEGKHYVVQNGKRVIPQDVMNLKINDNNTFRKTTGIGNYWLSLRYGDGVKDPTGNYYTTNFPEQILETYTPLEKEALAKYGVNYWGDLLPKASEFEPIPWAAAWSIPTPPDSELNQFWNVEQDVCRKYIPKAIMAKPSEFDAIYDEFLRELEKATAKFNKLMTALVQDRMRLWGYLK